jgi:peptide/nickel transport system ATP-binding protein
MATAVPYTPVLAATPRVPRLRRNAGGGSGGVDTAVLITFGLLVIAMLVVPWLLPYPPSEPTGDPLAGPSLHHLFGTDEVGRDVFSRVLLGMRSSWWGAVAVVGSGLVVGGLVGAVAGTVGGWVDGLLMRITDVFLALPGAIMAVATVAALGPSYTHTLIAVAIVWWPLYARIVRGEVARLRSAPHVDAARLSGIGKPTLVRRHLLPGAFAPSLVMAGLDIGNLVLAIAGLSFLGLGAPAPAPELGAMSARGATYLLSAWWVPITPALGLFVLAIIANLASDAARNRMLDR